MNGYMIIRLYETRGQLTSSLGLDMTARVEDLQLMTICMLDSEPRWFFTDLKALGSTEPCLQKRKIFSHSECIKVP